MFCPAEEVTVNRSKSIAFTKNLIFCSCFRLRSDHNEDKTIEVLYQWLFKWSTAYHHVNIEHDDKTQRRDSEATATHWSDERYLDVIRMKEEALNYGRKIWADFIFVS